jgi:uncharacterized protein YqhQ
MADEVEQGESKEGRLKLGGMALRNGLLIHGPTSWSAAVRDGEGRIQVASGPKPRLAPGLASRLPVVRGPLKLAEAFAVIPLVRRRLPAARLPFEDVRVLAAMALGAAVTRLLRRRPATAAREGLVSALALAPALVALRDNDLAAYHGAEHKTIGGYEKGEDPAGVPKEHERCGSNLVAPLLLLTAGGQIMLERAVEEPGPAGRAAVGLASASAAVEMFAWSERHGDTELARAFRRPGTEIQRLVATREPTSEQLEVAVAALDEILRVEGVAAETPASAEADA